MEQWLETLGTPGMALRTVPLVLLTAFAVAWPLTRPGQWRDRDAGCIVSTALGLALLPLLGFALGVAGLIRPWLVTVVLVGGGVAGLVLLARVGGLAPRRLRRGLSLAPVLAVAGLTLGTALCLPTAWDELIFHVALPQRWLDAGAPAVFRDLPFSGYPSAPSFLFLLTMAVGGIMTPRLLTWAVACVVAAGVYRLWRPGTTRARAAWLTFTFMAMPVTLMVTMAAYAELFVLLPLVATCLVVSEWPQGSAADAGSWPPWRVAALLGALAGAALAVKLTGGVVATAIGALSIWHFRKARRPLGGLVAFVVAAVVVAMPFHVRPWLATGNPFHPYLGHLFSADPAVVEVSQYMHRAGADKFGIGGLSGFVFSPVFLAVPRMFRVFDGTFGWQLLPVLALALVGAVVAWRRGDVGERAVWSVGLALGFYVFWFLSARQARFLMPGVFCLFLAASHGLRCLRGRAGTAWCVLVSCLALLSVPRPMLTHGVLCWRAALGRACTVDMLYSATGAGYLPSIEVVDRVTAADARLMLLFEHRGLYVPRSYVIGTPFFQDRFFTTATERETGAGIHRTLVANGITHVLVGLSVVDPDRTREALERSETFAACLGELVRNGAVRSLWRSDAFELFEVNDSWGE